MTRSHSLDVYLHDRLTGTLTQEANDRLTFTYAAEGLETHSPLSVALPVRAEPYDDSAARPFFSGLLPDDLARRRLARFLGLSEKNAFALLEAIGGDCAGAVSLLPAGERHVAPTDEIEILTPDRLHEILVLLKQRPLLAGEQGIRLSLAGAQDKIAVGIVDGKIALIKGGLPTTHILKPLISDVADSVANELFCLRLAAMMNLPAARAVIGYVKDEAYLLITRYDRYVRDGTTIRLHQEDFCQALSIAPERKYESEGGPSLNDSLDLLRRHSAQPAVDRDVFLGLALFNFLIGNADAHGKNFSLLYANDGLRFAPAYDLLSAALYPELGRKMAMKIGGEYRPDKIYLRHFLRHVPDTAAAHAALTKDAAKIAEVLPDLAEDLRKEFEQEGIVSPLYDGMIALIRSRAKRLAVANFL